jgi:hypothetical protein
MKHIKLFEQFDRAVGYQPLSPKQIGIYNSYAKEKHPYLKYLKKKRKEIK